MIDLRLGDCIEVMREMDANSVDAIVTDPPYGLEFMGKEWDKLQTAQWRGEREAWQDNHPANHIGNRLSKGPRYHAGETAQSWHYEWAIEALRVAKPGAHLLAFGGTRTFHRLACAIEDAGWEIRDTVMWVYGSGFPKSHDVSKAIDKMAGAEREILSSYKREGRSAGILGKKVQIVRDITSPSTSEAKEWEGWGTALKPAWEPVIVARKPVNCTVAENVLKWGTGAINIDACRVEIIGDPYKDGFLKGDYSFKNESRTSWNLNEDGDPYRKDPHPQGRWPANLIHDGSEEVVALFPQTGESKGGQSGVKKSGLTYSSNWNENKNYIGCGFGDSGSAARFFYYAKASKRDRDEGLEGMEAVIRNDGRDEGLASGNVPMNRSNNPKTNHHPTVKPTALMQYLCRLVTPPGGIVLDPFMGSGSTGKAAVLEGFSFIGIEKEAEYLEIAEKRIAKAQEQMRLPI